MKPHLKGSLPLETNLIQINPSDRVLYRHERLGVREHTRPACRFDQLSSARSWVVHRRNELGFLPAPTSQAFSSEGLHARRVCSFTVSRHQLGVRRPHPRPQTNLIAKAAAITRFMRAISYPTRTERISLIFFAICPQEDRPKRLAVFCSGAPGMHITALFRPSLICARRFGEFN